MKDLTEKMSFLLMIWRILVLLCITGIIWIYITL